MCLHRVKNSAERKFSFRDKIKAFKVVVRDLGYPELYRGPVTLARLGRVGDTTRARVVPLGDYPSGFHCFPSIKDAKDYVIFNSELVIEVELSEIHAEGFEGDGEVVVGKRIKIIREVK